MGVVAGDRLSMKSSQRSGHLKIGVGLAAILAPPASPPTVHVSRGGRACVKLPTDNRRYADEGPRRRLNEPWLAGRHRSSVIVCTKLPIGRTAPTPRRAGLRPRARELTPAPAEGCDAA